MEENRSYTMPLIGDKAPSFSAVTTQGPINFPEDYKGKWVILFSHPADFTPVCTTEFMTFATMADEFKALNTELIGLSVDSLYAHIAWLRKIQDLEWNGMKGVEVKFPLIEDIKMEVFRSSGAGGQHINKTSSAVRLIHKPSGMVVECQQERSQFQNRDKAMRILASRLYEAEQEKIAGEFTAERRSQVGTGMRNERIRTYNFPQGRVTDHRIGLTLYKIESIMDGGLDEVIDALVTADQAERLKSEQTQ